MAKKATAKKATDRKKLTPKKIGTGRYTHAGYLITNDKEAGVWPVSLMSDPDTVVLNDAPTAHEAFDQLLDALENGSLEALETAPTKKATKKAAPKKEAAPAKTEKAPETTKKAAPKKTKKLADVNLPEATDEQNEAGEVAEPKKTRKARKDSDGPRRSKVSVEMIRDIRKGYDNLTSGKMEYYRMKAEEHGLGLETVAKISRRDIHANVE